MSDRTTTPHHVQVHTTTTQRYEGGATNPTQQRYEGGVGRLGARGAGGGGDNDSFGVMSLFSSSGGGKGPSTSQIIAVAAGVPIGGTLLFLAGISFVATLIGLAIVTPLFILFSPVLVPAAFAIGLAVAGILTADACGIMGLMSFSWMVNYIIRQTQGGGGSYTVVDTAKRGMADMVDYVGQKTKDAGQKTKEVGQDIQSKAHEVKRTA
ncbi:hypothetical protein RIF29_18685 [Crotalaria pallida]|uniref:Oleosin n=1 Tax=Crotalaria pallida TaxID=3830 RepID=A0AAN9EZB4_CROPI